MDQFGEIKSSETQAIIDLASQITPVEMAGQDHIKRVALPPGWSLAERNDEALQEKPHRKSGVATLTDLESFIGYINRHKVDGTTIIYCGADYAESNIDFNCVFDDHGTGPIGQNWRSFRAEYKPLFSEEWKRWTKMNEMRLSQFEFAKFIEDNLNDIAAADGMPTGQQLLEMALSFQASQDMKLKSSIRLQDGGVNMTFIEESDQATMKQMKFFEQIAIGVSVFWGGTSYEMKARLRFRPNGGAPQFWFELIRADKIIEDATKTIINQIKTETAVPLYFGKP